MAADSQVPGDAAGSGASTDSSPGSLQFNTGGQIARGRGSGAVRPGAGDLAAEMGGALLRRMRAQGAECGSVSGVWGRVPSCHAHDIQKKPAFPRGRAGQRAQQPAVPRGSGRYPQGRPAGEEWRHDSQRACLQPLRWRRASRRYRLRQGAEGLLAAPPECLTSSCRTNPSAS